MSKKPTSGGFDHGDWGEFLAELYAKNKNVAETVEQFEQICTKLYQKLKTKGYPDEDIREILFLVDFAYVIVNSCADATIDLVDEYQLEIHCRISLTSENTPRQEEYLRMLMAKYKTSSGCMWGCDGNTPSKKNKNNR